MLQKRRDSVLGAHLKDDDEDMLVSGQAGMRLMRKEGTGVSRTAQDRN